MPLDSSLFVDVADAIGLGNPAIVEKDYYIVQLLKLLSTINFDYHQIVFSGGTALAKSAIKTYRMSEDVDIKLIPKENYPELTSRSSRKQARKVVKQHVETLLEQHSFFDIEEKAIVRDEYRYFVFNIRYPQDHQQAPCLRPFIKLEFIESDLLSDPEWRGIQSIYAEVLNEEIEVAEFACSTIMDTQAEKLLSMMRRTASVARNADRDDDKTLIRHIYDTYHIQSAGSFKLEPLSSLVAKAIKGDVERYGNQHQQMVDSPISELRYGLTLLSEEEKHHARYDEYVTPMVYADQPILWEDALAQFVKLANEVLDDIEKKLSDIPDNTAGL